MAPRIRTAFVVIALSLSAIAILLVSILTASLPRRAGEAELPELDAPVRVELDRHAVARLGASSIEDAFRAEGFMHAQERYFQMDLARRSAAGELAALIGPRAIDVDRRQRLFEFRKRATELASRLNARERSYLDAYAEGVNAGLADLGARPPEYLLLGQAPGPWTAADSLLVVFSIYTMLSNNDSYERGQGVMRATLPASLYEFLTPSTSRFDRPLTARRSSDPTGGYVAHALPGRDIVDVSSAPQPSRHDSIVAPPLVGAASNQWAVGPGRSKSGRAILANDPHLTLRIPNTFYRIELEWHDGAARGVSIPGVPGVLIGATDHVAWGATVSNVDQSDYVVIEIDPDDPGRYLTPEGSEPFETEIEPIAVAGSEQAASVEIRHTRWGPVVGTDFAGRPLALHATWLESDGTNLAVLGLLFAEDSAAAAATLDGWAGPSLNWMIVDTEGTIAWIVNGPIPRRFGSDGSVPEPWSDGTRGWSGYHERPRDFGVGADALFTANNRTLDLDESLTLSRFWMRPLRAHRIAELLGAKAQIDEADSLAMQLDTRAEGFEFFRALVLEVIGPDDDDPLLRAARRSVADWNGHADADQVGFRILQLYYTALLDAVLAPLLAPAIAADSNFVYRWPLADEPLRRILEARPQNFLPREFDSWTTMLRTVLRDTLASVNAAGDRPNAAATWGDVNRIAVAHPFGGLPVIGRWLRLDEEPVPGSMQSLRVAAPAYGAILRMSVSPGSPETGILEMPVGQSGHFLSANFKDMQRDWLDGTPSPFLAGPTIDTFELVPGPAHP